MGVTLERGRVVFQYNLGSGSASVASDEPYNDGQWHRVDVRRQEKTGVLKVGQGRRIPGR